MKIDDVYSGQPFHIVGWRMGAATNPHSVGWTRSPQNREEMTRVATERGFQSVQMRSVRNKKTGSS